MTGVNKPLAVSRRFIKTSHRPSTGLPPCRISFDQPHGELLLVRIFYRLRRAGAYCDGLLVRALRLARESGLDPQAMLPTRHHPRAGNVALLATLCN